MFCLQLGSPTISRGLRNVFDTSAEDAPDGVVSDVLSGYHGKGKEQWRTLVCDEYINNQGRPAKFKLPKIGLQMLKPAVPKKQRSAAEQRVDTMKKHALITQRALIESNITGEKVDIGIVTGQYGDVSYALFEERQKTGRSKSGVQTVSG